MVQTLINRDGRVLFFFLNIYLELVDTFDQSDDSSLVVGTNTPAEYPWEQELFFMFFVLRRGAGCNFGATLNALKWQIDERK